MIKGKRKYGEAFGNRSSCVSVPDYFHEHFSVTLDRTVADTLLASTSTVAVQNNRKRIALQDIGSGFFEQRYSGERYYTALTERSSIENFDFNSKLLKNFELLNGNKPLSGAQLSVYNIIGKYIDVYAAGLKIDCMPLYCLHTINHITRTRNLIIQNKQFLQERREKGILTEDDIENARDQGLSRPKVLIICPMKKDAFQIIENFRTLIFGDSEKPFISNYHRFKTEFGDTGFRISEKRKVSEDYRKLMSGNVDDCFRIGIGLAKKCLKLYTAFDESDILVASPLGLRMIVGGGDNADESADLLLMQNWEHLLNVVDCLHIRPKKLTVDISRVRQWTLEHFAKLYRQTIMISEVRHAECNALFARYCRNYAGFVEIPIPSSGLMDNIEIQYCQELQRIDVDVPENQSDVRFKFFKEHVLPKCDMSTVIFIPSYFDFVRIRNYLKNENESFVQLHEYAKQGKVAKARALFYKKEKKLMLLTERFYFYRRYNIKGIRSITFYQPPSQPSFYHELINQVTGDSCNCAHIRLIYTKHDLLRMANIFGDRCTQRIMSSSKSAHALVSR